MKCFMWPVVSMETTGNMTIIFISLLEQPKIKYASVSLIPDPMSCMYGNGQLPLLKHNMHPIQLCLTHFLLSFDLDDTLACSTLLLHFILNKLHSCESEHLCGHNFISSMALKVLHVSTFTVEIVQKGFTYTTQFSVLLEVAKYIISKALIF